MQSFDKITGVVAPLNRPNIDTDQIVPKQFLKRVERTGFGRFLFHDWRYHPDGSPQSEFVLNQREYEGAAILAAGKNFGTGSSREHAAWALMDYGFRAILAPSFADIFYNNCLQNGILPVVLDEEAIERIHHNAQSVSGYRLTVDLNEQRVSDNNGFAAEFEINPFHRHCLLNGLDEIALTLEYEDAIAAFERGRAEWLNSSEPDVREQLHEVYN